MEQKSTDAKHRERVRKILLRKSIVPLDRLPNRTSPKGNYSIVVHRKNGSGSYDSIFQSFTTEAEACLHIPDAWDAIHSFMDAFHANYIGNENHLNLDYRYYILYQIPCVYGFAVSVEYDFDEEWANNNRFAAIRRRHKQMEDENKPKPGILSSHLLD